MRRSSGRESRRAESARNTADRKEKAQKGRFREEKARKTVYPEEKAKKTVHPEEKVRKAAHSEEENTEGGEQRTDRPPTELSQLDSGITAQGILEVMADGFGFIRSDNYLPGENDVYVSPSQIRRFNLKTGDIISGNMRIKAQQEKFGALLYLKTINGKTPSEAMKRYNFEDMTPIFPNERMRMERGSGLRR